MDNNELSEQEDENNIQPEIDYEWLYHNCPEWNKIETMRGSCADKYST
jgi:hypothetical protein